MESVRAGQEGGRLQYSPRRWNQTGPELHHNRSGKSWLSDPRGDLSFDEASICHANYFHEWKKYVNDTALIVSSDLYLELRSVLLD